MEKKLSGLSRKKVMARIANWNWRQRNQDDNVQLNVWIPRAMMTDLKLEAAQKKIDVTKLFRDLLKSHGYGEGGEKDAALAQQEIKTDVNNQEDPAPPIEDFSSPTDQT